MSSQVLSEDLSCPGKMCGCKYPCCTFCSKEEVFNDLLLPVTSCFKSFSEVSLLFISPSSPVPGGRSVVHLSFKDFTNCSPFPCRESSSSAETASSPWVVCIEVQREPFFEKKVFFAQSRAKDKDKGHTLGTACHLYDC